MKGKKPHPSDDAAQTDAVFAEDAHESPLAAGDDGIAAAAGSADAVKKASPTMPADESSADSPARLRQQLEEAQRHALLAQAELENFRKRLRREMEDERRFAAQPLLTDLLGVVDNLRRAIEAAESNAAVASADGASALLEGVRMVATQLDSVMEKHHVSVVDPLGEEFDPNRHEAINQIASDEHPAGHVSVVYQRGYLLHDRVLRPAQVIVSTGPAAGG